MRAIAQRLVSLDRRIIFFLVALAVVLPIIRPLNLPGLRFTPEVRGVYATIERLPPNSPVVISVDFDPSTAPELYPMGVAILRHAFVRNLRVIVLGLWQTGTGIGEEMTRRVARELDKKDGVDYVFLGWAPGATNVIIGLGQDLYRTFPKDFYGKETMELPVLNGVRSLRDVGYVVTLAAGDPGIEAWYIYGAEKYRFPLGGGCTAVIAPGMYPYLNAGQINGLIGGMKGAAEYENLIRRPDRATAGMDTQSVTQLLIIVLILLTNVAYFLTRRQKGE